VSPISKRIQRLVIILLLTEVIVLTLVFPVFAAEQEAGMEPLTISNITVLTVTSSTAQITWSTNYASSSQIFYSTTMHASPIDYEYTKENETRVTNHVQSISGLSANTLYYFRVLSSIITNGNTVVTSLSDNYSFITLKTSSGGGGKNSSSTSTYSVVNLNGLISSNPLRLDDQGSVQSTISIITPDAKVKIDIFQGTKLLISPGNPLTSLDIESVKTIPKPPKDKTVIMASNFLPKEAIFSSSIYITFFFDPDTLLKGLKEKDLHVTEWDGVNWLLISNFDINTKTHSISFQVEHFGLYALMGSLTSASTLSPPLTATSEPTDNPSIILPITPILTPGVAATVTATTSFPKPDSNLNTGFSPLIQGMLFILIFFIITLTTILIVLSWNKTRI
jgi:hypothetical protein